MLSVFSLGMFGLADYEFPDKFWFIDIEVV